jgi:hypothetical protein
MSVRIFCPCTSAAAGVMGPGCPMFTQRRMFWRMASKFGSDFQ